MEIIPASWDCYKDHITYVKHLAQCWAHVKHLTEPKDFNEKTKPYPQGTSYLAFGSLFGDIQEY